MGYKWSPRINHPSCVDDTILFGSGDKASIRIMMKVLGDYESQSGQKINKSKSSFFLHDNTPLGVATRLRRFTGIKQDNFPFTYLGCPVYYGEDKSYYYEEILRKIARRILSWHNKLLSFGGKQILISHILQSMLVYLLTVMNPPKRIVNRMHQILARFL